MNFSQIQSDVLARGFDETQYGSRINGWINDAQNQIARRVDYYVDEATYQIATVSGTSNYPLPTSPGFARMRNLTNSTIQASLKPVSIRDIDNALAVQAQPYFYAFEGQTIRLYPTPDGVYNLQMRYWSMPTQLVNSTDVPSLPSDYHNMLCWYATWQAFEADDDTPTAQYWQGRFEEGLKEFSADQKFPNTDYPTRVRSYWEADGIIPPGAWVYYAG